MIKYIYVSRCFSNLFCHLFFLLLLLLLMFWISNLASPSLLYHILLETQEVIEFSISMQYVYWLLYLLFVSFQGFPSFHSWSVEAFLHIIKVLCCSCIENTIFLWLWGVIRFFSELLMSDCHISLVSCQV